MFKRHATFRSADFESLGLRPMPPPALKTAYANDNLRGLRRLAGQRRSQPPRLVCHWVVIDGGRLECRWRAPRDEPAPATQDFT